MKMGSLDLATQLTKNENHPKSVKFVIYTSTEIYQYGN
ncbi:hypothetical protein Osc7112_3448 [Oscillatoria nigro-viridis PCC 7112]|uniref:Uncharacterized protein n=1 Tax=Phormidium nigroviride PCC 7112 TaxID=179408 RepID=K9VJX4_9CYAN|nr:hypothetical protein Osc7112_3448 [Oscillatoria nigro-viridis PCC 7112]